MKNRLLTFLLAFIMLFAVGCTPPGNDDQTGSGGSNPPEESITLTKDTDFENLRSEKYEESDIEVLSGVYALYTLPHGLLLEPDLNFTAEGTASVKGYDYEIDPTIGETLESSFLINRINGVWYHFQQDEQNNIAQQVAVLNGEKVDWYQMEPGETNWFYFGELTQEALARSDYETYVEKAEEFFKALTYDEELGAYVLDEFLWLAQYEDFGENNYYRNFITHTDIVIKVVDKKIAYLKMTAINFSEYCSNGERDSYTTEITEEAVFYDYGTTEYTIPDLSNATVRPPIEI